MEFENHWMLYEKSVKLFSNLSTTKLSGSEKLFSTIFNRKVKLAVKLLLYTILWHSYLGRMDIMWR